MCMLTDLLLFCILLLLYLMKPSQFEHIKSLAHLLFHILLFIDPNCPPKLSLIVDFGLSLWLCIIIPSFSFDGQKEHSYSFLCQRKLDICCFLEFAETADAVAFFFFLLGRLFSFCCKIAITPLTWKQCCRCCCHCCSYSILRAQPSP